MGILRYFLLYIIVLCQTAYSDDLKIEEHFESINILPDAQWLLSVPDSRISEVIRLTEEQWSDITTPYSAINKQSLWLKFSLLRTSDKLDTVTLLLNVASSESVNIYMLDSKGNIHRTYATTGEDKLFASGLSQIPLPLYTAESVDVYVKYSNKNHEPLFARITSENTIHQWSTFQTAIIGVYSGALGILILLYIFTYIKFRDPVRFWFAILLSSYLLIHFNQKHLLFVEHVRNITHQHLTLWLSALMIFSTHKLLSHLHTNSGVWQQKRMFSVCLITCISGTIVAPEYTNLMTVALVVGYISISLYQATFWQAFLSISAARYLLLGWGCISLLNLISIGFGAYWVGTDRLWYLVIFSLFMIGTILQVMGIELFDRVAHETRHREQDNEMNDLKYFYQLFRSSAEGLYTSTIDGKVESINPAMCQLFGYESEQQFFNEITDTSSLYANKDDRQALLLALRDTNCIQGTEVKGRRRDGSEFWFSLSVQVQKHNGEEFLYGSIFNITDKIENANRLKYINQHDTLTSALNQNAIEAYLIEAIDLKQTNVSIFYINIDQLKDINGTIGFKASDALLQHVYRLLNETIEAAGKIGRMGSKEFVVVIPSSTIDDLKILAEAVINCVQSVHFSFEEHQFQPTISIGISYLEQEQDYEAESLLMIAEQACLTAKANGGGQHYYQPTADHSLPPKKSV